MIKQIFNSIENELHQWFDKLPKGVIDSFNYFSNSLIYDSALFFSGLSKKSTLVDNLNISYLEGGDPKKETLLLLHGFADNKYTFLLTAKKLSQNYHLIIPDLPAFGESQKPIDITYTFEKYSKWMLQLINTLNLNRVHVLGNSLGGAIAVEMAASSSNQLLSCTLIDSAGITSEPVTGVYKLLEQGKNIFEINNLAQFNIFLKKLFYKPPFMPFFIKDYRFKKFIANKSWYHKVMNDISAGMLDSENKELSKKNSRALLEGKLEKIKIPCLILWGDHDSFFEPQIAHIFHEKIKNSKLEILKDTGHMPQVESPKKFTKVVENFLKSI